MGTQMRRPHHSGEQGLPCWRWALRDSRLRAHGAAQNNSRSISVHGGRLSLLSSTLLALQLWLLLSAHNLAAFASDTDAVSPLNATIDFDSKIGPANATNKTTPANDLKEVDQNAAGQFATRVPPGNSTAGDEDVVISASEILSNPALVGSNRSSRLLERVVFDTKHEDSTSGAQTPKVHENEVLFVPHPSAPPFIHPQTNSDDFESMNQHASRLMLQMFLLGLMIFITLSLCIVYAIKFCLCRRRKAVRMLMRRALVGDLAANQQAIGSISRPADNFLLTECSCHHQHNAQLAPVHHNDCIEGYHYFSGAAHGAEPASPIQSRNSMILTLIQRLQQTLLTPPAGDSSRVANVAQPADNQQQQQLVELIATQLQAQLIASGCLQNTCLCQHHQLMGQVLSGPAQRPPAYHELFRHQPQNQRQVPPSAPQQQVTTCGVDMTSSRSSSSDQEEGADRREL